MISLVTNFSRLLIKFKGESANDPEHTDTTLLTALVTSLDLSNNALQSLPAHFALWFSRLTALRLPRNRIARMQDQSVLPTSLTELNLSYNSEFDVLPDLSSLTRLHVLALHHNAISSLPHALPPRLRILLLHNNPIDHVPIKALSPLKGTLQHLSMKNCKLNEPAQLRPMSVLAKLRHFSLEGNPLQATLKTQYRALIRELMPHLVTLDGDSLRNSGCTGNYSPLRTRRNEAKSAVHRSVTVSSTKQPRSQQQHRRRSMSSIDGNPFSSATFDPQSPLERRIQKAELEFQLLVSQSERQGNKSPEVVTEENQEQHNWSRFSSTSRPTSPRRLSLSQHFQRYQDNMRNANLEGEIGSMAKSKREQAPANGAKEPIEQDMAISLEEHVKVDGVKQRQIRRKSLPNFRSSDAGDIPTKKKVDKNRRVSIAVSNSRKSRSPTSAGNTDMKKGNPIHSSFRRGGSNDSNGDLWNTSNPQMRNLKKSNTELRKRNEDLQARLDQVLHDLQLQKNSNEKLENICTQLRRRESKIRLASKQFREKMMQREVKLQHRLRELTLTASKENLSEIRRIKWRDDQERRMSRSNTSVRSEPRRNSMTSSSKELEKENNWRDRRRHSMGSGHGNFNEVRHLTTGRHPSHPITVQWQSTLRNDTRTESHVKDTHGDHSRDDENSPEKIYDIKAIIDDEHHEFGQQMEKRLPSRNISLADAEFSNMPNSIGNIQEGTSSDVLRMIEMEHNMMVEKLNTSGVSGKSWAVAIDRDQLQGRDVVQRDPDSRQHVCTSGNYSDLNDSALLQLEEFEAKEDGMPLPRADSFLNDTSTTMTSPSSPNHGRHANVMDTSSASTSREEQVKMSLRQRMERERQRNYKSGTP